MHYANGREAKPGDLVVSTSEGKVGVLHTLNAGAQTCNGRIAPTSYNDPYVTVGECLHFDDVKAGVKALLDSSKV